MSTIGHVSGAYLVNILLSRWKALQDLRAKPYLPLSLLVTAAVDIDILFFKRLGDHHNSLLHTPIFWTVIFLFIFIFGLSLRKRKIVIVAVSLLSGAYTHLFLDWYSGKSAGIMFFYPLTNRAYSLFPLNPDLGKFGLLDFLKHNIPNLFRDYLFVTLTELTLMTGAFILSKKISTKATSR